MFSLKDKINYYRQRMNLSDFNKSAYARGFVNGVSSNHTKKHYIEDKKDLAYYFRELKNAKTESDRQDLLEAISNCKGCIRGYEAKSKH